MNNINIKITTTIISAIAALSLASCGETGDSVAPRREIKDTSSSVSENDTSSVAETTSSSKTTTTTAKAESEKSSVTTTSIVVLKDGKGNIVTQFAVDESGKTISLDKDSKAKTTTKKSSSDSTNPSSSNKNTTTKKTSNGTTNNNNTSGSVTYNTYTYDNGNSGNYNNYSDNTSDNSGYSEPQPAQTEAPKKTTTTTTTTTAAPAPAPAPAANWLDDLSDLDRAYYNFAYGDFSDYDWNLICDDLEKRALSYNGKKGSVDLMVDGIYWPTVNYTFDGTIRIKRDTSLWVGRDSKGWYNGTYSGGFNPGWCKDGAEINDIEKLNWYKGGCYASVDDAIATFINDGTFNYSDADIAKACKLTGKDESYFYSCVNFDWYITAGGGGAGKDTVFVVLMA